MNNDTICALATSSGLGAISIIRLSGKNAIKICNDIFPNKNLTKVKSQTIHYGEIIHEGKVVDEVLISIFKNPKSYTGEDVIELSCHGSPYIEEKIIQILIKQGARIAKPGEFTLRAFLNRKLDLSQAEAVADLIASDSEAAHQLAINQMRGGFSYELKILRDELVNFASLIELELDFSEEDVEFANRKQLNKLLKKIENKITLLIDSFELGNVIKNGIPIAILGAPNTGKSTLLNTFFNEDKAIVSDISGTTRDTIEDDLLLDGIRFRFIDTAGLRKTKDKIEKIGVEKAILKGKQARIVLYLIDATYNIKKQLSEIEKLKQKIASEMILVINKIDQNPKINKTIENSFYISAKTGTGIQDLKDHLSNTFKSNMSSNNAAILSNSRHLESLSKALHNINNVTEGLNSNLSGDLLSIDIRQAIFHIGEITGEITTNDLLENIFSKFCIGK